MIGLGILCTVIISYILPLHLFADADTSVIAEQDETPKSKPKKKLLPTCDGKSCQWKDKLGNCNCNKCGRRASFNPAKEDYGVKRCKYCVWYLCNDCWERIENIEPNKWNLWR